MFGLSAKEKAAKRVAKLQKIREEILTEPHVAWLNTVVNNNVIAGNFDQAVANRARKLIERGAFDTEVQARQQTISKERKALRSTSRRRNR